MCSTLFFVRLICIKTASVSRPIMISLQPDQANCRDAPLLYSISSLWWDGSKGG